jgi:hypothetical protein
MRHAWLLGLVWLSGSSQAWAQADRLEINARVFSGNSDALKRNTRVRGFEVTPQKNLVLS